MLSALAFLVLFQGLLAYAQSSLQLGYIPLAVKTPYLSGWILSNNGSSPERVWPNFYLHNREFGWAGIVRVDGQPFVWMGNPPGFNFSTTVTSDITPTKSIFRIAAGPIQFNVTFFTPIEPSDYVRQSMPFSYMYIDAFSASDSLPHTVQMYSDVSAQWVTFNDTAGVVWDTIENADMVYHRSTLQQPQSMVDENNFVEDGIGYYAMLKRSGFTWQTCADVDCRGRFGTNGSLANTKDTTFRTVNDRWPVYAFAVDLGTISPNTQPEPIVSALGLVRDPLVTYTTASAVESRSAYYMTQYSTPEAAMTAFLNDFSDAQSRNSDLDSKIMNPANAISTNYAGVLAFVTRQLFASMDITVPRESNGNYNASDVRIFMKDMGSSTRANPVEVIYGAFPALLFFNSSIAADLLKPLLEFQSSPAYRNNYAAPDLGASYPIIHGNSTDTHPLGVESSSSMLIMIYAHAVKSGDGSLLTPYYSTLQRWADYLLENLPHLPGGSITADNMNGENLSNEALKGILGIYCMGKINEALGVPNTTYTVQATQLINQWKQLAISGNHIASVYGQQSSWSLMYNIFPSIWLDTGLIDDDTLNNQAQFYSQQIASKYGFALDSSQPNLAFPHWTMLTAATIPQTMPNVRDELIGFVYQRVYTVVSTFPLPETYDASTGQGNAAGLAGSAIHGAAYGLLALSMKNVEIQVVHEPVGVPTSGTDNKPGPNVGAIVGGVIGGIAIALIFALGAFFFWRRKKQRQRALDLTDSGDETKPRPFDAGYQAVNSNSNANLITGVVQSPSLSGEQWSPASSQPRGQGIPDVNDGRTMMTYNALPPGAAPPRPLLSSKQREALGVRQYHHVTSPSESAVSTLTNPYSSSTSGSASGTEDLRAEVERLRREMDSIRHIAEPPPGYD